VDVDLGLPPATPPAYLYHGTVAPALDAIRAEGLRPMSRHDVHLSPGHPRRRPPRPPRRAVRRRGSDAPGRPHVPRQRQRRLAHGGRPASLPAVSRLRPTGPARHGAPRRPHPRPTPGARRLGSEA
jgi:hypothetical protein